MCVCLLLELDFPTLDWLVSALNQSFSNQVREENVI